MKSPLFFLIWLTAPLIPLVHAQELSPRTQVITLMESGNTKQQRTFKNKRLYVNTREGRLMATQFGTLPKNIRGVSYAVSGKKEGFGRPQIEQSIRSQMMALAAPSISQPAELPRDIEKGIERFMKGGKRATPWFRWQWMDLGEVPIPEGEQVSLKTGVFTKSTLSTVEIPCKTATYLPNLDPIDHCVPLERFYQLKEQKGYGLKRFNYLPYVAKERKLFQKEFVVHFQQNSAQPLREDLVKIEEHLRQNKLSIVMARFVGGASIEGNPERNSRLALERAQRLVQILQKNNNEPIGRDTLQVFDPFPDFRKQLLSSIEWRHLDTLTNEALVALINADEDLRIQLEPFLAFQRQAKLQLVLTDSYTDKELVRKALIDYKVLSRQNDPYLYPKRNEQVLNAKMLGIIAYMEQLVIGGKATQLDLVTMVDMGGAHSRVLFFYHLALKEEGEKRAKGSYDMGYWQEVTTDQNYNDIGIVAIRNIISLILEADKLHRLEKIKRLQQAVDIQYYTIKFIKAGKLDPNQLCEIVYPNSSDFYGLKLNHLAILHELSRYIPLSCMGKSNRKLTNWSEEPISNFQLAEWTFHQFPATADSVTYDRTAKSDYYEYVKILFLHEDPSVRKFVETGDNFLEFDLLNIVRYNVDEWDPLANKFYDAEVPLEILAQWVDKLMRMDRRICKADVHQVYLDFHQKNLLYLQRYGKPGHHRQVKMAENSLRYISGYYAARAQKLSPALLAHVVENLIGFYELPTVRPSTYYAAYILNEVVRYRTLTYYESLLHEVFTKENATP